MTDAVAIQLALYHGLRSCKLFDSFNVVLGREFLVQSEIEMDALWLTPRNGCAGLGLIVQLPTLNLPKPNSLQRDREFSVGIYEERNVNWTPGAGSMMFAEDVADLVIDFLWNWRLWRTSGLILQGNAVVPDERFSKAGILGLQARVTVRQERRQPPRPATPVITNDGGNITITVTDGSPIYFTRDGYSFPAPSNEGKLENEQAAVLYTEPFVARSGDIIMAAAWTDGLLPSQVATLEIS